LDEFSLRYLEDVSVVAGNERKRRRARAAGLKFADAVRRFAKLRV
jgi:hypothetical protein